MFQPEFAEIATYVYLNFLLLKHVILQIYTEMVISHDYYTSKKFALKRMFLTKDKRTKTNYFSVIWSLMNTVRVIITDIVLVGILTWFFGTSVFV